MRLWLGTMLCVLVLSGIMAEESVPVEAAAAQPQPQLPCTLPEEESPKPTDIIGAARAGDLDAVKAFMSRDAACIKQRTKQRDTPLHWAASCEHLDVVKYLLAQKPELEAKNIGGSTPLHLACRTGNTKIVTLLLEAGASVEAREDGQEKGEETHDMPLHIAARRGDCEMVELLLKYKAPLEAKLFGGQTALDVARESKQYRVLKMLKKRGAQDKEDE